MTATFFGASFDATDAARIAQSWAAALDRRVADGADEHDAVVEAGDPSGAGSTDSPATGSRSQEEGMTMATREPRIPGPDHPIRIEGTGNRVVVRVGAHVVADTTRALTLYEATYPPVQYIPLDDVDQTRLAATDARTAVVRARQRRDQGRALPKYISSHRASSVKLSANCSPW